MKKYLFLASILIVAGAASAVQKITDNFDWGANVTGRTSITNGQTLADGLTTQAGGALWTNVDRAAFSGTSGVGTGTLTLTGNNSTIRFGYTPQGGWTNTAVTAVLEANYTSGTGTVKGLYFGFQSATNVLINNATTDKIFGQIGNNGTVYFKSIVGGQTNNAANKTITFSPGDKVKMELTVDVANKSATLITTGVGTGNTVTSTLSWTTATPPDWTFFAVNQTGYSTAVLDSVSIAPDPATIGMLGYATPPRAIPLI